MTLLPSLAVALARDEFHWLGEINKASAVMVVEQGIVPRSGDYLIIEQDIGATFRRLFARDDTLAAFGALIDARDVLLTMAEAHRDAIVPAYTWGVQAQPISFGHYLGGYVQALSRDADRYREAWVRVWDAGGRHHGAVLLRQAVVAANRRAADRHEQHHAAKTEPDRSRGPAHAGQHHPRRAEAQRIFVEAARSFKIDNQRLPLTEAQFRRSLTAENMVQAAQVLGGPQPVEVTRMLAAQRSRLQADRAWLAATRGALDEKAAKRNEAFAKVTQVR
jgi:hypothetical protein